MWAAQCQQWDFEKFCAILPSSLHALQLAARGRRVSLPDLRHLTALTELHLDWAHLNPTGGQLPRLTALRVLSLVGAYHSSWQQEAHTHTRPPSPGPQDLGLAYSTPLLAEVRLSVGSAGMSAPHKQLATLASLAQLRTIVLACFNVWKESHTERRLRPDTLLSLPPSVTKLVLCNVHRCVPAVALPENIAIVHDDDTDSE